MRHEAIRELLHEYRDGELDTASAAAVAAHLPSCAECRGVLEGWERLSARLLRTTPKPDEAFVGRVMAGVALLESEPAYS